MSMRPKPLRSGVSTFGPPRSRQDMRNRGAPDSRLDFPLHGDAAARNRQRAVLGRVGRQLMQGKAQGLRRVGSDVQGRSIRFDTARIAAAECLELLAHELVERDAGPVLVDQQVLRCRQALHPADEPIQESVDRRAEPGGLLRHGLDDRQQVLGAVRQLVHHGAQQLLAAFALADVVGDLGGADDPAVGIPDRRYRQQDSTGLPSLRRRTVS